MDMLMNINICDYNEEIIIDNTKTNLDNLYKQVYIPLDYIYSKDCNRDVIL